MHGFTDMFNYIFERAHTQIQTIVTLHSVIKERILRRFYKHELESINLQTYHTKLNKKSVSLFFC